MFSVRSSVNNTKKVYHPLRKKQTKNAKIKVYQKAPKHHQKDRPCANEIVPAKWLKRGVQA